MKAHASLAGLLAGLGLAVALAGCSSGQGSQQPAAHPSVNPAQVARQFAQCVRDHGDPSFPDPTIDGQRNPQLPLKASPRWPHIRAVWTGPCKRFNPQGHVWAAS